MNLILKQKAKKQVIYAVTQFLIPMGQIILIVGLLFSIAGITTYDLQSPPLLPIESKVSTPMLVWTIILGIILAASEVSLFVIWILGIVNATQINNITNDSILLIIFAIFPFIIVHLIIAIMEKNKFMEHQLINNSTTSASAQEQALKHAFDNNVISAEEYEEKRIKLKEKK